MLKKFQQATNKRDLTSLKKIPLRQTIDWLDSPGIVASHEVLDSDSERISFLMGMVGTERVC